MIEVLVVLCWYWCTLKVVDQLLYWWISCWLVDQLLHLLQYSCWCCELRLYWWCCSGESVAAVVQL